MTDLNKTALWEATTTFVPVAGEEVHGWRRIGDFRMYRWCKTHGDWVGHMIPFDGRLCRWALEVNGTKPCEVVDRWMEAV